MKKPFLPENLADIRYVSELTASPDGRSAAFTRYEADRRKNEFIPQVYRLDTSTGTEKPALKSLSRKPQLHGSTLYYLVLDEGTWQVWREEGGLTEKLTSLRHGISSYAVSETGRLAVETCLWPGEDNLIDREITSAERRDFETALARKPHVAEDFIYKLDDAYGLFDGRISRIGIVEDQITTWLSPSGVPGTCPAWTGSGQLVWYGMPYAGVNRLKAELYLYDGQNIHQQSEGIEYVTGTPPVWLDGLIASSYKKHETGGVSEWLYRLKEGQAEPLFREDLPDDQPLVCQGVNALPIGRSTCGEPSAYYQAAGEYIYFLSAWQGRQRLYRLRPDGEGKAEPVGTGILSVHEFAVTDQGIFLIGGDLQTPADLFVCNKTIRRLTYSNEWLDGRELAPTHHTTLTGGDISFDVWVVEPAGRIDGKLYPAVLDIHGGPECTYVHDFWHEFRALSSAGLSVIYCNPRGSSGYGPATTGGESAWGAAASTDLHAAIDYAAGLGFVDRERLGVTGGSYGGYMTVKLISTTGTFKAAAGQRILCNLATSYGTGDMGFASAAGEPGDVNMRKYLLERAEKSLITKVDDINVPLLLLHGYKDYRCGYEQAEQLFIALHERKPDVPVRLVMFPDENHGITRTGKPNAQIRHLSELINWFVKHLGMGESKDA